MAADETVPVRHQGGGGPLPVVDFLIAAAREFRRGGWVFTGFHWPVLAGHLAHDLNGADFVQVFEAGGAIFGRPASVPTSTTDYHALDSVTFGTWGTADVLLGMGRRYDRAILDASNVDLYGRVNSSFIGPRDRPAVRLAGGGGAADIAAASSELVLLHGGDDLRRMQRYVEHTTVAPAETATVRLVTRWGRLSLGVRPRLVELVETPGSEDFVTHLRELGVNCDSPAARPPPTSQERRHAAATLRHGMNAGYRAATAALDEVERVESRD